MQPPVDAILLISCIIVSFFVDAAVKALEKKGVRPSKEEEEQFEKDMEEWLGNVFEKKDLGEVRRRVEEVVISEKWVHIHIRWCLVDAIWNIGSRLYPVAWKLS